MTYSTIQTTKFIDDVAVVHYDDKQITNLGELLYDALAFDRYSIPHIRKRIEIQLKQSKLFERKLLVRVSDSPNLVKRVNNQRVIVVNSMVELACYTLGETAKQLMSDMGDKPQRNKRNDRYAKALIKIAEVLTRLHND